MNSPPILLFCFEAARSTTPSLEAFIRLLFLLGWLLFGSLFLPGRLFRSKLFRGFLLHRH